MRRLGAYNMRIAHVARHDFQRSPRESYLKTNLGDESMQLIAHGYRVAFLFRVEIQTRWRPEAAASAVSRSRTWPAAFHRSA